jgi:hypothetical protein
MTTLEPIIAVILGAGLAAGAGWAARLVSARNLIKHGPILSRVYDVLDPLLERNLPSWSGSDVEFAIELAIESVSDAQLTAPELKELVLEVSKRWLPQVAADKVRRYEALAERPKTLLAADLLTNVVAGKATKVETLETVKQLLK